MYTPTPTSTPTSILTSTLTKHIGIRIEFQKFFIDEKIAIIIKLNEWINLRNKKLLPFSTSTKKFNEYNRRTYERIKEIVRLK